MDLAYCEYTAFRDYLSLIHIESNDTIAHGHKDNLSAPNNHIISLEFKGNMYYGADYVFVHDLLSAPKRYVNSPNVR